MPFRRRIIAHRGGFCTAPAGFGKTTLISQWLESLGRPAAWLTVEEGDDESARLAAYLHRRNLKR